MWVEFFGMMGMIMPLLRVAMTILVIEACCKYLYGDKKKEKREACAPASSPSEAQPAFEATQPDSKTPTNPT